MPTASPAVIGAILDDIVARLVGTGDFGPPEDPSASWGAKLEVLEPEAASPAAAVEATGGEEQPLADNDFGIYKGTFAVTVAVREDDIRERGGRLGQLEMACRNALANVVLAGVTQPWFTRLGAAVPVETPHPEGRIRMAGTYRFAVDGDSSRDESDDD